MEGRLQESNIHRVKCPSFSLQFSFSCTFYQKYTFRLQTKKKAAKKGRIFIPPWDTHSYISISQDSIFVSQRTRLASNCFPEFAHSHFHHNFLTARANKKHRKYITRNIHVNYARFRVERGIRSDAPKSVSAIVLVGELILVEKNAGEVWVKRESPSSTADKWKRWATPPLNSAPLTPLLFHAYLTLAVRRQRNGQTDSRSLEIPELHPAVPRHANREIVNLSRFKRILSLSNQNEIDAKRVANGRRSGKKRHRLCNYSFELAKERRAASDTIEELSLFFFFLTHSRDASFWVRSSPPWWPCKRTWRGPGRRCCASRPTACRWSSVPPYCPPVTQRLSATVSNGTRIRRFIRRG